MAGERNKLGTEPRDLVLSEVLVTADQGGRVRGRIGERGSETRDGLTSSIFLVCGD